MNAPTEPGLLASAIATKVTLDNVRQFCGLNAQHYLAAFERLAGAQRSRVQFHWAALLGGPYWAAARGLWGLFWLGLVLDTAGACWALSGLRPTAPAEGILVLAFGRLLVGFAGNWSYWQAFCTWRVGSKSSHRFDALRLVLTAGMALPAFALIVLQTAGYPLPDDVRSFPAARSITFASQNAINEAVRWLTVSWGPFFDAITIAVRGVLDAVERVLLAMPWPSQVLLLLLVAWRAGGVRAVLFAGAILAYLGFFGFWEKAISTMSLVAAAVLICVVWGVPLGILCAKYRALNRIANPVMDFMQTMPSFVYLLPAIAFFSIGKPPAVLATVVFAMPPVIKLTALGIQQVPREVREAMLAFGASPLQLLVKAELPMAASSIMTGINQSIMMSLSMVVISALIGAGGLGFDVLSALQQMENGAGLLAGLAIVLCAMLLDRLVQGRNGSDKRKGKE